MIENFDQAVIDYREAVKVKSEILSEDNMELTEAYPFSSNFKLVLF